MSADLEPADVLPPPRKEGHQPRSSRDKGLTAFAQLGCLRLNAKRGVVTILDSTKQYIIAEATKSLSLLHDSQHSVGDELWFGNAFIERERGVSADAMYPETYVACGPDGSSFSAPALVVSDIAADKRYENRGYAGHGVSFYCGVPITTRNGHVIGVYTVTDDKSREGLSPDELRFMVDMAVIVSEHLENVKNNRARKRGERLTNGIGIFIEGESADENDLDTSSPSTVAHVSAHKSSKDPLQQTSQETSTRPEFLGMVIGDANARGEGAGSAGFMPTDRAPTKPGISRRKSSGPKRTDEAIMDTEQPHDTKQSVSKKKRTLLEAERVFDRAASILRHCLMSDGVAFFDASSANLSSGSRVKTSERVASSLHHSKNRDHRRRESRKENLEPATQTLSVDQSSRESSGSDSSSTTARSSSDSTAKQAGKQACEILGISLRRPQKTIRIPEQTVRRFVRRHPHGKCFAFDQFGRPASSDDSSESAPTPSANLSKRDDEKASGVGPTTNALLRALPGARNIVLLPLWDFAKERWHSGLVIWSGDPGRLTNVQDDMVYLKAFGNAVMNEVNRINLALSDTAKSTFLANISHELRSPLHGILGSIEFLHDTEMDDFQSSMVISVETCGKTLLDTVNHVLDHAKLNSLSKSSLQGRSRDQPVSGGSKSETSLTEDFDLATVVEEAVEAVYAGQVFRSADGSAFGGKGPLQTAAGRAMLNRQEQRNNISEGSALSRTIVRVTLNIDGDINWNVRSQPGAIRRIVMNILGNALKYTNKGSIDVTLVLDTPRKKSNSNLHVLFKVTDTGRGMSDEFLKNHAFTAFSQEDSLATGTGLGLSIVRQIVDSLGGKIDLSSEKDLGTEIKIWLTLPKSQQPANLLETSLMQEMRERTQGLEMCILLPFTEKNFHSHLPSVSPMPTVESSMRSLVAQWFRMKVTTRTTMEGLSPDFFVYPEPPPIDYLMNSHGKPRTDREIPVIVMCTNAFEAASVRSNGLHQLTDIGKIIEVIPQPCGPQKLAKVLHRCMQRLNMLEEDPSRRSSDLASLSLTRLTDGASPSPYSTSTTLSSLGPSPRLPADSGTRHTSVSATNNHLPEVESVDYVQTTDQAALAARCEGSKPRILVVDDNHINLQLLITSVRKAGHPFEPAVDGMKALQAYKRSVLEDNGAHAFKYILMDISMPVMNGVTATKEIRQFEKESHVKQPATIIALTGLGSEVAQNEAIEAGFDNFLSKPIVSTLISELRMRKDPGTIF